MLADSVPVAYKRGVRPSLGHRRASYRDGEQALTVNYGQSYFSASFTCISIAVELQLAPPGASQAMPKWSGGHTNYLSHTSCILVSQI